MLWQRARLSLILCAFGRHAWQLRRTPRMEDPDLGRQWVRCSRCGALQ